MVYAKIIKLRSEFRSLTLPKLVWARKEGREREGRGKRGRKEGKTGGREGRTREGSLEEGPPGVYPSLGAVQTLHRRHRQEQASAGTRRNNFQCSTSLGKLPVFWRVLCRTVRCPVKAMVPVSHPSRSLCRAAPPILTLDVPLGLPQPAGHQHMGCDTLERVLLKHCCCRRRRSLDPMRLRGRTPAQGPAAPKCEPVPDQQSNPPAQGPTDPCRMLKVIV